jgi:fatty acid desaturase
MSAFELFVLIAIMWGLAMVAMIVLFGLLLPWCFIVHHQLEKDLKRMDPRD